MTSSETLRTRFLSAVQVPSDINEHLDLLRILSSMSNSVCELGIRQGCSTTAILFGGPKIYTGYDLNPIPQFLYELAREAGIDFRFRQKSTILENDPPTCDFLFIDSLHTGDQVYKELTIFAPRCSKWIAFHDTSTFWHEGEFGKEGIGVGIMDYSKEHEDEWKVLIDRPNNNGLLVWEKIKSPTGAVTAYIAGGFGSEVPNDLPLRP